MRRLIPAFPPTAACLGLLALTVLTTALGGATALTAAPPRGQPPAPSPLDVPLTPHERTRVDAGQTVARLADPPGAEASDRSRVPVGIVAAIVDAPPERVFRAVIDYGYYHQFMPFMVSSQGEPPPSPKRPARGTNGAAEAVGVRVGGPIWRMRFDPPFPAPETTYRVVTEHAVRRDEETPEATVWTASWRSLPGRGFTRGSWTLTEVEPGKTLVVFRTQSDAGSALPRFLQNRLTLKSLPWVLDGLRQHVLRCRYALPQSVGCRD